MSVAETFLREGRPLSSYSGFEELTATEDQKVWHVVTCSPCWWCPDLQTADSAQRLVGIFLLRGGRADQPAAEWQLLRHHYMPMKTDATESYFDAVKKDVAGAFERTATGARPHTIALHFTAVENFDGTAKGEERRKHQQSCCAVALRHLCDGVSVLDPPEESQEVVELATAILGWLVRVPQGGVYRSFDYPALSHLIKGSETTALAGLSSLKPLLTDGSGKHSWRTVALPDFGDEEGTTSTAGPVLQWRWGIIEERKGSTPLVHLLPDPGDALWIHSKMTGWNASCERYDDFLHEEGEIVASLSYRHSRVPFADIEHFGWDQVIPKILYRCPATDGETSKKPTPMDAGVRKVNIGPLTEKIVATALRALHWISENYGSLPPVEREAKFRCCAFCARPRQRTGRCANCHACYYCNRAHQANDWKSHKGDCQILSHCTSEVQHFTASAEGAGSTGSDVRTRPASDARVFLEYLTQFGPKMTSSQGNLEVHVSEIDDVDGFLEALAQQHAALTQGLHPFANGTRNVTLISDHIPSEKHNEVFVLSGKGVQHVASSGTIGDSWRETTQPRQSLDSGEELIRVRVCKQRYHHYLEAQGSSTPNLFIALSHEEAVDGLGFFDAVTRILLEQYVGKVHCVLCFVSRIAAFKTKQVLTNQMLQSDREGPLAKSVTKLVKEVSIEVSSSTRGPALEKDFSECNAPEIPMFFNGFICTFEPVPQ